MARDTREYEITFLVEDLSDNAIDLLYQNFDCLAGDDLEGRPFVTMTCTGPDAFRAAQIAITSLACVAGVRAIEIIRDLVTRSEIADRAQVSRQTVALWVSGQRRENFPAAISSAGGGIWLWGDVHRWLVHNEIKGRSPHLNFPAAIDYDRINAYLHAGARDVLGEESARVGVYRSQQFIATYRQSSMQSITNTVEHVKVRARG